MAGPSNIEWCTDSWNPIVGCSILSPGCTNCYAMKMAARVEKMGTAPHYAGTTKPSKAGPVWTGKLALAPEHILTQPLRWKKPRAIFVNSMGDLFHEDVPDEWIDRVFAIMALCPQHTFQVLTKRSARMREYMNGIQSKVPFLGRMPLERIHLEAAGHMEGDGGLMDILKEHGNIYSLYCSVPWPLPNVWLGVSAERQAEAEERIPDLLATPAAIRFVSAEPLLGPIDFETLCTGWDFVDALKGLRYHDAPEPYVGASKACPHLDQIIVGGESGTGARPMHPDWARLIRDQCARAVVPFFFKQWGSHQVVYDRDVDDPDWRKCAVIRRRYPAGRWLNLAGGHGFHGERVVYAVPVIKHRAGRLLDGVEHNGVPARELPFS
ncbi:MAG: hypothetical protein BGN87_00355 [Rhizobiales bacterium 65-79]|nr:phage Gp37/Gp68 family protein [Hyphomicrobiales bacterium]OJU02634.1 MAG: hypothetical protein BGN87_00355 [Rhizobiales bacterium 65-79]